jgi:heptaprenyl diphosphate synthase
MTTRTITNVGMFSAAGTALFVFESFIPTPLPFIKIGLANLATLLALLLLGARSAFVVVIIRVLVGSLMVGSLFGPGFLLAISSGLVSAAAMGGIYTWRPRIFSVHVTTQLLLVLLFYVRTPTILFLLPLLLISALFGGLIVGWIASKLLPAIARLRFQV